MDSHCALSANGNDNTDADPNNIIFTIKDTQFYDPAVTLSTKGNQKLSKLLAEDLKDQHTRMNIKQKVRIKIRQMSKDIFSNQTL